ncbi:MAG TPA: AAA family ATPase [Thermotogota bacterium]|nr:AAA family ATPase [Thermotogota bacterium]HQQ66577.1 AAA family ATPase [Thermotogota bacterium]
MSQVYPEKSEQLELSVDEKSFLRTIVRAFPNEEMAYYVLHINPRKKDAGEGKPELFNLLLVNKGIILFRFIEVADVAAQMTIKALSAPTVYEILRSDIAKRLEESRYLTDTSGKLRFALNVCIVFPNADENQVTSGLDVSERQFCSDHVIFKDTLTYIRKKGAEAVKGYLGEGDELQEDQINNVFQRLCPEITIPRKYILDENGAVVGTDGTMDTTDRAVQSYRLDSKQIDIINKIAKGNQLILACAGSGKSVLLISKCFKLASLNPSENFLITCYNRNLNNYYQWAIAQAGFSDKNVLCSTFFGLCKLLLVDNGLAMPAVSKRDNYYDRLFLTANNALSESRIRQRYYGIFIDEVQIFKPEWYRFCFNLLKRKNADDHFFTIAGDKSQDIKNNIKHGKAPWQGGGEHYPEYRGKTLPIETNYRNSKPINEAIDRYVDAAKTLGKTLGVDLTTDPELFLRGTAYRDGNEPTLIELSDLSNKGEGKAIAVAVRDFIDNKGLSEVDIAIILYNKTGYAIKGWEDYDYKLLPSIKKYFSAQNWENPAILIPDKSEGATYGSRRGVTITTIEGSLGLDFRAVVLAGLRPLGIHEKARTMAEFETAIPRQLPEKLEAFKKNINFLYTGCTRAKDELTIILSAPKGESIYMDLLRQSMPEVNNR